MLKNSAFELRTIGNLLHDRRKKRGLTLEQVSSAIRIRLKYVKALEEGDNGVFPSEVYLKGFLKNYAKFLGITTDRALAMYRREREYERKTLPLKQKNILADRLPNFDITPQKIIFIGILLIVIVTIFYISSYVGKILQPPILALEQPTEIAAGAEEIITTNSEKVTVSGTVEIGSDLTINGELLETKNFEKFNVEFTLQEGLNKYILVAESQFGKKSELTLNVIYEVDSMQESANTETTEDTTSSEASILSGFTAQVEIVDREAYIETFVDGEIVDGKVFQVGEILDYTPEKSFSISTPRPDAITVTINDTKAVINSTKKYTWKIENGSIVLE